MRLLSLVMGFSLVVYGCGDEDSQYAKVSPVDACEDLAAAIADTSVRCENSDREAAYNAFVGSEEINGCSNIDAVKDGNALYKDCFPALETIECNAFIQGNLPVSCKMQLIKER